jgi:hypothetical protein
MAKKKGPGRPEPEVLQKDISESSSSWTAWPMPSPALRALALHSAGQGINASKRDVPQQDARYALGGEADSADALDFCVARIAFPRRWVRPLGSLTAKNPAKSRSYRSDCSALCPDSNVKGVPDVPLVPRSGTRGIGVEDKRTDPTNIRFRRGGT